MSRPIIPSIIRGPAIVTFNGQAYYTQGDIKVTRERTTFDIIPDFFGKIETRMAAMKVKLTFTPVGELGTDASLEDEIEKYWPHGPITHGVTLIPWGYGGSICNGPVTITTNRTAGVDPDPIITYEKAAITKPPTLYLSTKKTFWGPMEITAIGNIAATSGLLDEAYIKTQETPAEFADVSFNPDRVLTEVYSAAIGVRGGAYAAVGCRDGFEIEPQLEVDEVQDDNVGIADLRLLSIGYRLRFAPNNLTEAQVDALVMDQDANAILAGETVAKGPGGGTPVAENIVITGSHLVLTMHKAGIVTAEHGYGVKVDNNGNIEYVNRTSFTLGAPTALITAVVS